MTLDSRQLAAFLAIVDHGSLGRAAEALHITQPALSRTIKRLETQLGAALFERYSKGMAPSAIGHALLPHARLRVSDSGEVEVAGALFLGYLGDREPPAAWWPTGDLGRIDDQGHLWLQGRRKNVLITAFGRNVSPEWVETTLRDQAAVLQAVVLGDGQPSLAAVLWPTRADLPADLRNDVPAGPSRTDATPAGAPLSLERLEEQHIRRILEQTPSMTRAAEILGIDQATLYRKRQKLGLL